MRDVAYYRPLHRGEFYNLMGLHGAHAAVLAGGTSLIPQMRNGDKTPKVLVDIGELNELAGISLEGERIAIGAATTISKIAGDPIVLEHCPILAKAAKEIGNFLTRNRATLGGNLADASPCADTAPPLLALEAEVHISDSRGQERVIPMEKFFAGYRLTQLFRDEVITRITIPKPGRGSKGGHTKLGLRKAAAICVASVALMVEKENGLIRKARIAFGSVAPQPVRAYRLEEFLEGKSVNDRLLAECEALLQKEISPIGDIRGSEGYRREAAWAIFKRNLVMV